jgi:hypothetical protein
MKPHIKQIIVTEVMAAALLAWLSLNGLLGLLVSVGFAVLFGMFIANLREMGVVA